MKDEFVDSLEGKGRPRKKVVRRKVCGVIVPPGYKSFTEDTKNTFACFGPPESKKASRYITFMKLILESNRALTMFDLHQLCTGKLHPPTNKATSQAPSIIYGKDIRTLCRLKYLRKLAYGRRIQGMGRPNALYIVLPKGEQSVKKFKNRIVKSPYYDDVLARVVAEKKRTYDRTTQIPKEPKVKPNGRAF